MENQIKALRKAKGLTQAQLAERLNVTRQTILAIEQNKYDPTLKLALELSHFFDLTVNDIFTEKTEF